MRRIAIGLGAVAVLSIGTAIATGAIPNSDGTVNVCYVKSTGAVRVIDTGQGCKNSENPLNLVSQVQKPRQYQVLGEFSSVSAGGFAVVEASCAVGDVPTGGGYFINGPVGSTISSEHMSNNQRGWSVTVDNETAGTVNVAAQAMCLDYTP